MPTFDSVEAILDYAIGEELSAERFYRGLAAQATNEAMRAALVQFAEEEAEHARKLTAARASGSLPVPAAVVDLQLSDYQVEVVPTPDLRYADALILAAKRERAACRLYNDLARRMPEGALRGTLRALAAEEARHKLRFETEYDEQVLDEH